jgi:hypothetical protein
MSDISAISAIPALPSAESSKKDERTYEEAIALFLAELIVKSVTNATSSKVETPSQQPDPSPKDLSSMLPPSLDIPSK